MSAVYNAAVPGCQVCARMKVKVTQDESDQRRCLNWHFRIGGPHSLRRVNDARAHLIETQRILASHLLADHGIDVTLHV
jgi:hypothetical protein